jgi:hypothetical protein
MCECVSSQALKHCSNDRSKNERSDHEIPHGTERAPFPGEVAGASLKRLHRDLVQLLVAAFPR